MDTLSATKLEVNKMPRSVIFQSQKKAPALIIPRAKDTIITRNPIVIANILYPLKRTKAWSYKLSQSPHLTLELIEEFEKDIQWVYVSYNPCLTPAIIKRYGDKLIWSSYDEYDGPYTASANPSLMGAGVYPLSFAEVTDLIDGISSLINWSMFCEYQKLTIPFLDRYLDRINWDGLSLNKHLTVEIFERYIDKWGRVSFNQAIDTLIGQHLLTPDFIERHHNLFSPYAWESISYFYMNESLDIILDHPEWPWDFSSTAPTYT